MQTRKLSDTFVRKAKPPEGQPRIEYYDTWQPRPGCTLILRVGRRRKTWILAYRSEGAGGRRPWVTLGHYPQMSLADAHDEAIRKVRELIDGIDPAEERDRQREAPTLSSVCDRYMREHATPEKQSASRDQELIDRFIKPQLGDSKACEVGRQDIRGMIRKIQANAGGVQSNRVLALCKTIYSWSVDLEIVQSHPAAGLKPLHTETPRDRVYSDAEIRALWRVYDSETSVGAVALRLIALTAQRPGEVMQMHADHIDGRWWTIPASVTKNGVSHRVYLTDLARQLIEPRLELGWICRGRGGDRPINNLQKSIERTRAKAGLADGHAHDWRRTAGTRMASMGITREVVGRVLNHADRSVTAVYDRHSYDDEKRRAMMRWEKELRRVLKAGRD